MITRLIHHLHTSMFMSRYRASEHRWAFGEITQPNLSSGILISGFFDEPLGIGRAGTLTAHAFEKAGVKIARQNLRPLHSRLLTRTPHAFPAPAKVWIIQANPPEARIALFAHRNKEWSTMYRIGYWVWETSLAPVRWLDTARWFHEIWVPSPSSQEAFASAFRQHGETQHIKKLRYVPHPVSEAPIAKKRDSEPPTVLTMFDPRSDLERKNPEGVICVWLKAFPQPSQARLIIKSHHDAPNYPAYTAMRTLANGRPDIEFINRTLDLKETHELIAQSDIFISLHRAEGFGLSMAEAMSMGVPVIATGWSGNMAFMTDDSAALVPYRLVPANTIYNGPQALWAEPNLNVAASLLTELCADASLRRALGELGQHRINALANHWNLQQLFPQ